MNRQRAGTSIQDGTRITQAASEVEMLATAKRWAAEASAEASVLAWAETGAVEDDPWVDRAWETLLRDETLTVENLIRGWQSPGPDPAHWLLEGTLRTQPQRRARKEPAAVVEGSTVEALLRQGPSSGEAAGFIRIPIWLVHGGIVARLERVAPGTTALVIVLLRYAERRAHEIRASKATLCRLTGISKPETLDRRLRLLTRTNKAADLPALLRKLPTSHDSRGHELGVRFAFRQDGLEALATVAQRTVEAEERRLASIRKAQRQGGLRAMRTRWGSGHKSDPASRGGSYQRPGKERERVSPSPSGTWRDKSQPHRG